MSLGDVREGLLLFLNMEWVRYSPFTKNSIWKIVGRYFCGKMIR